MAAKRSSSMHKAPQQSQAGMLVHACVRASVRACVCKGGLNALVEAHVMESEWSAMCRPHTARTAAPGPLTCNASRSSYVIASNTSISSSVLSPSSYSVAFAGKQAVWALFCACTHPYMCAGMLAHTNTQGGACLPA